MTRLGQLTQFDQQTLIDADQLVAILQSSKGAELWEYPHLMACLQSHRDLTDLTQICENLTEDHMRALDNLLKNKTYQAFDKLSTEHFKELLNVDNKQLISQLRQSKDNNFQTIIEQWISDDETFQNEVNYNTRP
jgi:hypothetical protein